MQITIRPAKETEANQLSEIAITAKKHWGYPEAWFELWGNAFEITPDYILSNHVWVADSKSETLGFAAISVNEATAELEHMWVHPNYMRKGVGKTLMNKITT